MSNWNDIRLTEISSHCVFAIFTVEIKISEAKRERGGGELLRREREKDISDRIYDIETEKYRKDYSPGTRIFDFEIEISRA